jgi:cytochrome c553
MRSSLLVAALSGLALSLSFGAQAQTAGNPVAAKGKISMCIGCHAIPGYKTAFPVVYSVPALGGQSEQYIVAALTAYKKGDRHHPSMRSIATSLSEQDMADIAAYYSSQK